KGKKVFLKQVAKWWAVTHQQTTWKMSGRPASGQRLSHSLSLSLALSLSLSLTSRAHASLSSSRGRVVGCRSPAEHLKNAWKASERTATLSLSLSLSCSLSLSLS